MRLPITFDLTPKGEIVEKKEIGQDGYIENIQYNLQFNIEKDGVYISYMERMTLILMRIE